MNPVLDVSIVIIAVVGLWFGATWVVESAARIARRLAISELVIGLTVVSIGTSAPEFAVTVSAALAGHANISVGNVVGSNIFNLGFILGGVAFVRALDTSRPLVYRDGSVLIGATLLLLVFLSDLHLARWEGLVLLGLLVSYLGFLIYQRQPLEESTPAGEFRWYDILRLLAGLAVIVVSGHFLVEAAVDLARALGVSEWVIGVTIVAAGTSTPEFFTSLVAVTRGRHGISAGNLIGSDIFNLLGVLGLAATLRPMTIEASARGSLFLLSGMVMLVFFMARTGWKFSRLEGGLLVLINLIRWVMDFMRP